MIEQDCTTCESYSCYARHDNKPCQYWSPNLSHWDAKIAALEAEVERLTKERDEERGHAKILSDAVTYWQGKTLMAADERDAALAQVVARDEEIAALRAQAEDWAAQYRALSASVESERAGLRHSLAEVEDERDEAVSAMAEWRARAEVAEPERDRLRDGLRETLEFVARCRWDEAGEIPPRDFDAIERLRALLGEAKEGGAL